MEKLLIKTIIILMVCFSVACSIKSEFVVSSPDGEIVATMLFDKEQGTLNYSVNSRGKEIITASPVGINTDRGDFRSGMTYVRDLSNEIDETYSLPQGKASTYRNHATELTLRLKKEGNELDVIFRVYNDGAAFRFIIPGTGDIEVY